MAFDKNLKFKDYFKEEINIICKRYNLNENKILTNYLTKTLENFISPANFFISNNGSFEFPRLSQIMTECYNSKDKFDSLLNYQKLGDTALFTISFFEEKVTKNLVDRDYYVAIGESAYSNAGRINKNILKEETELNIFFELAKNFKTISKVLEEISLGKQKNESSNILCLYKKWKRTNSNVIKRILLESGMEPKLFEEK